MGMADIAEVLWRIFKTTIQPTSKWADRDRFRAFKWARFYVDFIVFTFNWL